MSIAEDSDDPAAEQAARALSTAVIERFIARIRAFELTRAGFPEDVRGVTGALQSIVFATPAEMARLRAQMSALLEPYLYRPQTGGHDAPANPDP